MTALARERTEEVRNRLLDQIRRQQGTLQDLFVTTLEAEPSKLAEVETELRRLGGSK